MKKTLSHKKWKKFEYTYTEIVVGKPLTVCNIYKNVLIIEL